MNNKKSEKVTVIINNKELLEWPRLMCEKISKLECLDKIIILDNGSSSRKLLQWYKNCEHEVIFLENLGHTAAWISGVLDKIETNFYVVTDPDLDISEIPDDTLIKMIEILNNNPDFGKVGLSLCTDDVPESSPYFQHVNQYEKIIQSKISNDGKYMLAPVDTTFALYDKRISKDYKVNGVRMVKPYEAKHNPWYYSSKYDNSEFENYINKADSNFSSYKKFTTDTIDNKLKYLYQVKKGKVSTKWSSYFEVYEKVLSHIKDQKVSLLEIGVQNGGSLDIWAEYFDNAVNLVGCDINPKVEELEYNDPRIKVIGKSATHPETHALIKKISSEGYDVIIDDGSHRSMDTLSNFINYFDLLKPGGFFIIEDMHCAYWEEYGGGYFNDLSISNFMKKIPDLINIEHCREDYNAAKLFKSFFMSEAVPEFLKNGSIYSISSYNSIYVIEKSSKNKLPILGNVVIVGEEALVDSRVLNHKINN